MDVANIFGFKEIDQPEETFLNKMTDENQMMQETSLENNNTTLPPSSYKGNTKSRPVGGTREAEDKQEDLYKINVKYINDLKKQTSDNDINYVINTFQYLNRNISLNGKVYTLDKLQELMTDPTNRRNIISATDKLQDDPSLDAETRWKNIENRTNNVFLYGQISHWSEVLNKELYKAGDAADAKGSIGDITRAVGSPMKRFLFDENGKLRTEKQFNEYKKNYIKNKKEELLKEYDASHPITDYQPGGRYSLSGFAQKSDMGSWLQPLRGHSDEGDIIFQSPVANPLGLSGVELWNYNRNKYLSNNLGQIGGLDYKRTLNNVIDFYNDPKSQSTKFKTIAEKKFTVNNKGGEIQSQTGEISFDFNNAKYYDEASDTYIKRAEIGEFNKIAKMIETDPGMLLYNSGEVVTEPSNSETAMADIKNLVTILKEDRSLGKKSPKGKITFQPNVEGEDGKMYDAYTFKLDNNYFSQQKFKGNKVNNSYTGIAEKNNGIYFKQGFTVYIPSNVSAKNTQFGIKHKEASTTSSVEALMNTTGSVSMEIPGAGALTLSKDNNTQEITVSGYAVQYKPENGKYDTVPIKANQIIYGDPTLDVDKIVISDYLKGLFKDQFFLNDYLKKETLKQKGVKDPNQLTGQ